MGHTNSKVAPCSELKLLLRASGTGAAIAYGGLAKVRDLLAAEHAALYFENLYDTLLVVLTGRIKLIGALTAGEIKVILISKLLVSRKAL